MGIGNGKKKGYNRYFSSLIITIHLPEDEVIKASLHKELLLPNLQE